jgi:hypothetical protein
MNKRINISCDKPIQKRKFTRVVIWQSNEINLQKAWMEHPWCKVQMKLTKYGNMHLVQNPYGHIFMPFNLNSSRWRKVSYIAYHDHRTLFNNRWLLLCLYQLTGLQCIIIKVRPPLVELHGADFEAKSGKLCQTLFFRTNDSCLILRSDSLKWTKELRAEKCNFS